MAWPAALGMDSECPSPMHGRSSPDPRGGAAQSGAALGVTLAQDAAPGAYSGTQHVGPGTCPHRGG